MNTIIAQNKEWIDSTWAKVDKKLSRTAVKSRNKLPYTTVNGTHNDRYVNQPDWWTNGFWGGMMWLMYEATGNEDYKKTAERSEVLLDTALANPKKLHHDVGFMWHLTSGASYRLTGSQASFNRNFFAAATLFSRFNYAGDYIRAWNGAWGGNDNAGYSIIDCLMNLPLLYWASEEIGDDRFKQIAMRHADMALRDHIRPDGSTNHIVDHYTDKVGVKQILGGQGYEPTTCWSRGLAWAVYGTVISYIHTKEERYLEAAKKTADYFIEHCRKTDYLPVIDFGAPETPVYYDSTAGVCTACGLLELAPLVSEEEGRYYTEEALKILKACDAHFCNYEEDEDALVLMGSERYPLDESMLSKVHLPIIYGDFFYVEALCKLRGSKFFIW